jgi:PTS system fructose-specific IIC component/PTS system nitrogen regulatory IIA component
MLLHELFKPEYIKIGLEAEDKDEVFEELVDFFCTVSGETERDDFVEALREREAKMSTGIQPGVAVPHGKTNAVDKVHGVLGVSKKGVDYDALDGKPVYLFFMIMAPERDTERHLLVLKRLAELLEHNDVFAELLQAETKDDAFRVICKYEEIVSI